jgi:hypothetical protein
VCEILRGRPRRVSPAAARYYWDVFRRSFDDRKLPAHAVASLDEATDRIVEQFDVPESDKPFQARVNVLAPVGTGKSAHVVGAATKAIDAGYRLVVVLSPPANAERAQLQNRLADVLGGPGILWITGYDHDYRRIPAGFQVLNPPNKLTSLLVVKRNAAILRKLAKDIGDIPRRDDLPALILDADGGQLLEGDVTDQLIEKLMDSLPRAQYVRFTDMAPAGRPAAHEALISIPG